MDLITRRFGGKPKDYAIYTKEEAEELGMEYTPDWKKASPGDWALTDDGYIVELHKRKRYVKPNRVADHFTFTFCRKFVSYKREGGKIMGAPTLEYEPFRAMKEGSYTGMIPQSWAEQEEKKTRTKRVVKLYARIFLAQEGELSEDDWEALGRVYRPDQKVPVATVRRLFKEERIIDMVAEELKKLLGGKGLTEEAVLDMYESIRKRATKLGQMGVAKSIVDTYRDMLAMKAEQKRTEISWEGFAELEKAAETNLIENGEATVVEDEDD